MYLHLGNDIVVKTEDIIGIFDLDNTTVSAHTRKYLSKSEKKRQVIYVSYDLPKAFIVCKSKKDKKQKIYARNYAQPPSFVAKSASVENSYVAEGCLIKGKIKNSIIFTGCVIDENASVCDSVVMPNTHILSGADIKYSIIGENVIIGHNAHVGDNPENCGDDWGISVVGKDKSIEVGQVVKPDEII